MNQPAEQLPATPPPAPAGAEWIDLKEAARRLGLSSDAAVRRFRLPAWIAAGYARQDKPASGKGKKIWYVREDADPLLARVKQPEHLSAAFDLRTLTDKQRRTVNDRLRLVKRWETERAAGVTLGLTESKITANFLQRLLIDESRTISRRTLFNWLAGYRREGIAGLVDERWKTAKSGEAAADPFLEFVRELYLSLRRPKLTVCHEIASLRAQERGWTVRSYKTCQRAIDAIPRAVVLKRRFGEEAHTNEAQPFIERDYSTLASNEIWTGDHHQCDVWVAHQGKFVRPWLSAWQDARSRKIVGFSIFTHDPNQDSILAAFRAGVVDCGVPQRVYVDNGKDYDCYALQGMTKQQRRKVRVSLDAEHVAGVFGQLGVMVTHCEPYHGQSKPIERFFNTLEDRFGRTWETYCGKDPAHRPEDLPQKLKAGRAPSLEDFAAALETWLSADYHQRAHGGDAMNGQSPDQVYAACLGTKLTAAPELIDLLLLKPTRPVKVAQNGVTYNGLRYGQYEPALQQLLGKQVVLRIDPRDVTRVSVWTEEGRFVCDAPTNGKVPFNADEQTLRAAIGEKRRHRRVMADYHQVRPRLSEDLPDLMIRAAAAANKAAGTDRPDPSLPPPSLKPVQSPLAAGLKDYQRAVERKAVGAESLQLAGLGDYQANTRDTSEGQSLGDVTDYLKYRSEDRHE
jgi:hypothetical protein